MVETDTKACGAEVTVHLAEQFTPQEAGALHRLASRVPSGTTLDLDFTSVRVCHDVALLLLARDVIAGTARYAFRGLSHHQARLLGYLGAQVEPAVELDAG
jgi:hypothetical protein